MSDTITCLCCANVVEAVFSEDEVCFECMQSSWDEADDPFGISCED